MLIDKAWNNKQYLWNKYKHLSYLLYYIVIGVFYYTFNNIVTTRTYMYFPLLDDKIPFIKEMVIPYVLWYAYIVLPIVYFAFTDVESYTNLCLFIFVGMTICFLIFAIFPNGQNLRPDITENDIFSKIIAIIYETDNPINSAPSMHALNAMAVHFVISKSKKFKDKKYIVKCSAVLMILIVCSTVMIKQHSIIDVLAGIILALLMKSIIYSKNVKRYIKKTSATGMYLLEKFPDIAKDVNLIRAIIRGDSDNLANEISYD